MSKRTNIEVVGCPFCGETPTVEAWHGGGHDKHMVSCTNDACPATPAVTGATRADAIRLWNTRKLQRLEHAEHAERDGDTTTREGHQ